MTTLTDYLYKRSTKPVMLIRFQDHHISGRIYGIGTPLVTKYKYSISMKNERLGRSFSHPVENKRWTSQEIIDAYEKKGWQWDWVCPYSGYEIDCLVKEEPFTELPKGENLVGITCHQILRGRRAIEDYMSINFRSFAPIAIYKVPENLL